VTEVWFYHLERQPIEAVLPRILAGMYARGDSISVHAAKPVLEELSKRLWAVDDVSFVPHCFGGENRAATAQIILCTDDIAANAAQYRFYAQDIDPVLEGAVRASLFFDGNDENAVASARDKWKTFRAQGCAIKYWKQSDTGRWEDQAVKKAA
jgi:DNA polymerase III subunit chi